MDQQQLQQGAQNFSASEYVNRYSIAGCVFNVCGKTLCEAIQSMPGFSPFLLNEDLGDSVAAHLESSTAVPSFSIVLSEKQFNGDAQLQYTFQSDGVDSQFSATSEGYLLQMNHDDGSYLHLWSDTVTRTLFLEGNLLPQMLRFALWTGYGIMTVNYHRIPIHGSCIVSEERAFLFLGESGTGKSTHTRLWRQFIPGSQLLNDDSPIIVADNEGIFIYGSPWSGKTPCYKSVCYPLGGCVRLYQAPYNKMMKLSPLKSYAALHPSCPPEFAYDEQLYLGVSETLDLILSNISVYQLACLPNEDAARLSHHILSGH